MMLGCERVKEVSFLCEKLLPSECTNEKGIISCCKHWTDNPTCQFGPHVPYLRRKKRRNVPPRYVCHFLLDDVSDNAVCDNVVCVWHVSMCVCVTCDNVVCVTVAWQCGVGRRGAWHYNMLCVTGMCVCVTMLCMCDNVLGVTVLCDTTLCVCVTRLRARPCYAWQIWCVKMLCVCDNAACDNLCVWQRCVCGHAVSDKVACVICRVWRCGV